MEQTEQYANHYVNWPSQAWHFEHITLAYEVVSVRIEILILIIKYICHYTRLPTKKVNILVGPLLCFGLPRSR